MKKEFYLTIKGEKIHVTEEQYREYKRPVWAEKRKRQRQTENGTIPLSLDLFLDNGFDYSDSTDVEEIAYNESLLETLYSALRALDKDDYALLKDLFTYGKSVRDVAKEKGFKSHTSVQRRKDKILSFLREKLKNFMN
jgi:DNA-directed RNA polymerase specialized sigma subunit